VDVDWSGWLARWHRQRQRYVPGRAERFALMADYLECARSGSDLYILDCCCGPGSLAQAMLDRFPTARVVAVDIDPWLVELGRRTITDRSRDVDRDRSAARRLGRVLARGRLRRRGERDRPPLVPSR
jgi:methylase of polypeptide subunit release factors